MLSEYRPWPARANQLVYDARSNIPLCQISISSVQMPRGPLELRAKGNLPKASAKIWRDDPRPFRALQARLRGSAAGFVQNPLEFARRPTEFAPSLKP
jgi:hypothetical protein